MNNAIKLAIEKGGYKFFGYVNWDKWLFGNHTDAQAKDGLQNVMLWWLNDGNDYNVRIPVERIILDPLFWQALGKALGWNVIEWSKEAKFNPKLPDGKVREAVDHNKNYPQWLYHAEEYFHLVLTGGDTEKFWKELIK